MYTGIRQTQAVVYRRARHCEPQCMAHALSSYHGPHRMNDTTFCRLRDIWARQEHASQIDKYKKSGNIRNNTVEKWSILEATSSSSVQTYLKRQTNGSNSYVKESLRECNWQFGVYHNSSTMTFSWERSIFFICNIESFSLDSYWLIDFHAFVTVTYGWHFGSFQIVG